MRPLKAEVDAIAALLEEGAESPQDLAKLVIEKVDEVRAGRTFYTLVGCMGIKQQRYFGRGTFSTKGQAQKAWEKDPASTLFSAYAIVPTISGEGIEELIKKVDAKPELTGDWALVAQDREAFKRGEKPRRSLKW